MNACVRLLFVFILFAGPAFAADADGRFSHTLSATELQQAGLDGLTSDQVAVIDALVRRDLTARLNGRTEEAPKIFSQRLTADERRIAGLEALSADELVRVNAFVERHQSIVVARELLAPPVLVSRHTGVRPQEEKAARKIHGQFSIGFGWGSGDYSERTASMVLHTELRPGLDVSIGYSHAKIKGGEGIYYYRDPYRATPVVTGPPSP